MSVDALAKKPLSFHRDLLPGRLPGTGLGRFMGKGLESSWKEGRRLMAVRVLREERCSQTRERLTDSWEGRGENSPAWENPVASDPS